MKPEQTKPKVLVLASVASMISQFNMPNLKLLQEMGYEVHVACNFKEGNTCSEKAIQRLKAQLSQMYVRYHPWDCPRNIHSVRKCLRAANQLWMLTGTYSFAWIHCQSPVGAALARIIAYQRNIRIIYTAHGFHFYQGAPYKNWLFYYPVEKLLSYHTDRLLTINKEDYLFAKKHLNAKKILHIYGVGVDLKRFHAQSDASAARKLLCNRYQIPQHAVILLSVGELNHGKNHKTVLAALAAGKRLDIHYIICGQGKLRKALARAAKRFGLEGRVHLAGYQENILLFYQGADLFIFPSIREGMPAALMEAMAVGLPCVVSDIRGNRELIHDSAMRFSPKRPKELCNILDRLLDNPWLWEAAGRQNQRQIRNYQLDRVQGQMRAIYAGMQEADLVSDTDMQEPEIVSGHRKPLVSVLIATYQPDFNWLEQLFRSIQRQSFQNYQILLMDDGSGQMIFERIRLLAETVFGADRKVTLLQSGENEGSNRTFEKLALLSDCPYLAFCDQDDIWEPEKLKRLLQEMQKQHAVLAYSDMSVIDANGNKIRNSLREMRRGIRFVSGEGQTAAYIMDNCTAACSMLVRREAVRKAVPFDREIYCDQWVAACAAACGRIAFVDAPLVRYRRHGNNQTETLAGITRKKDYYQKRILPACRMVSELRRRGIHYPQEQKIWDFVLARKQGNLRKIWNYRSLNKKYACFDLLMYMMPDFLAEKLLLFVRKQ